jgi:hypothetical protein
VVTLQVLSFSHIHLCAVGIVDGPSKADLGHTNDKDAAWTRMNFDPVGCCGVVVKNSGAWVLRGGGEKSLMVVKHRKMQRVRQFLLHLNLDKICNIFLHPKPHWDRHSVV